MNTIRYITTALLVILFFSCSSHSSQSRLPIHNLNLVAYRWVFNDEEKGWEIYVASFCYIDTHGKCYIARKDTFMQEEKYFEIELPKDLIDQIKSVDWEHLQPAYLPGEQDKAIYDGFTYCFIWVNNNARSHTKFIPRFIPDRNLTKLYEQLNALIWDVQVESDERYDYSFYKQYITTHVADSTKLPPFRGVIEFKESDVKR